MTEHKIRRERGGSGMMSWIQPVCSCGWVGRKEYAYADWQMANVEEQEADHLNTETRKRYVDR